LTTHPDNAQVDRVLADLVDGVLVINLDSRPDRWDRMRAEAAGILPADCLGRVPAVLGSELPGFGSRPWFRGKRRDTTWAARGGCTLAHRRALQTARDADWERVLILEDDVNLPSGLSVALAPVTEALGARPDEWDVCYLGYTDPASPFQTFAEAGDSVRLVRVYGCNCAHAYLINARARDWLLSHLPDERDIWPWLARNRAVDRWYLRHLGRRFRVLAVAPSLINQRAGFSDIVGRATDYVSSGHHRLDIPRRADTALFTPLKILRSLRNRLADLYDALRAMAKRRRGF
jgi:GR25 family glycosyltransferase involved in LPS biosynthesis